MCKCSQLNWIDVDQTLQHHPDCKGEETIVPESGTRFGSLEPTAKEELLNVAGMLKNLTEPIQDNCYGYGIDGPYRIATSNGVIDPFKYRAWAAPVAKHFEGIDPKDVTISIENVNTIDTRIVYITKVVRCAFSPMSNTWDGPQLVNDIQGTVLEALNRNGFGGINTWTSGRNVWTTSLGIISGATSTVPPVTYGYYGSHGLARLPQDVDSDADTNDDGKEFYDPEVRNGKVILAGLSKDCKQGDFREVHICVRLASINSITSYMHKEMERAVLETDSGTIYTHEPYEDFLNWFMDQDDY